MSDGIRRVSTPSDLLYALAVGRRMGQAAGATAQVLAQELGVPPRRVRKLVTALREQGVAIAGRPGTGYFVATTADEAAGAAAFLERRALHSLRLASRIRKIALPELVGQLKLTA